MKKKDILLIVVLLAAGLIGLLAVRAAQSGAGATVEITVDGEVYGDYDLDKDQTIEIKNDLGYNKVVIADGTVDVTDADCRDKICVNHAKISKDNETIICLPHKLVVEIKGGSSASIDANAQ